MDPSFYGKVAIRDLLDCFTRHQIDVPTARQRLLAARVYFRQLDHTAGNSPILNAHLAFFGCVKSLAKSIGDRFYDGIHFLSDVPPKAPPLDREVTDWLVRYADVSIKGGQNNQNIRHKAVPRTSSTPTRDVDTVDFPPHTPRKPQSRSVANTLNDPRLPSLELTDHAQTNDLLFPPNLEIYDSELERHQVKIQQIFNAIGTYSVGAEGIREKQEGEREMDGASPSKSGTVTLDHTSRSSPEAEGSGGYGSTDAEGDDDPEAYSSDV